jgi:hypothetical protein
MNSENMRERHYQETYDATIAQLTIRRRLDQNFTIDECQKHLQTEYINQGNDWVGRGSLQHIVQEATIAAYEAFIAEWRSEMDNL